MIDSEKIAKIKAKAEAGDVAGSDVLWLIARLHLAIGAKIRIHPGKVVISGKVCGQERDALDHTHDAFNPKESHRFEPEDAAPAPKVVGWIDDYEFIEPSSQQTEKGGMPTEPEQRELLSSGEVTPATRDEAGARVAGALDKVRARHMFREDEWIERKAAEEDGANVMAGEPMAQPGAGGAQAFFDIRYAHIETDEPFSGEQVIEFAKAYAAHVTKGLEARIVQLVDDVMGMAKEANKFEDQAKAAEARNVELMGDIAKMERDIGLALTDYNDEKALRETAESRLAEAQKACQEMFAAMEDLDLLFTDEDRATFNYKDFWSAAERARAALRPSAPNEQEHKPIKAPQCPVCGSYNLQCPEGHAWEVPTINIKPEEEKKNEEG